MTFNVRDAYDRSTNRANSASDIYPDGEVSPEEFVKGIEIEIMACVELLRKEGAEALVTVMLSSFLAGIEYERGRFKDDRMV